MKKAILVLVVYAIMVVVPYQLAQSSITVGGTTLGSGVTVWDEVVDFGNPTDNPCSDFASAIRPWQEGDGSHYRRVLVTGRGSITDEDFYDVGNERYCIYIGGSATFDAATDHSNIDTNGGPYGRLHVKFDKAMLLTNMTGQSEPSIVYATGGGYTRGFVDEWDAAGASGEVSGTLNSGLSIEGNLEWYNSVAVEQGGWVTGETPILPLKTNGYTTTTVGWLISGAHSADMSRFHFRATGATIDNDDVGVLGMFNNRLQMGEIDINKMGVGVLLYGSQNGNFAGGQIAGNVVGISFGDVGIGGNSVVSAACTKGAKYCLGTGGTGNSRTEAVTAWHPRSDLMIESNTHTNIRMIDLAHCDFTNVNTEFYSTMTSYGTVIGGGVDSTNTTEPCCTDAEATNNCNQVSGASVSRIMFGGTTKSISDRDHDQFKAICLGPSFHYNSGPLGYVDFSRTAWHDTDTCNEGSYTTCSDGPLFEFDADADAYVILRPSGWQYDANVEIPAYQNIRFDGAQSATWSIAEATPAVDGSDCLRASDAATGAIGCSTRPSVSHLSGWPYRDDVYVHTCDVHITYGPGATGWAADDQLVLQMECVDVSDDSVSDLGNAFTIKQNSCAGASNCADRDDLDVYVWLVNGRCQDDEGYLQINIDSTSVDPGGDAQIQARINCNQISVP